MPKYIITSDLHIRLDNLSISKKVLKQIETYAIKYKVSEVLILGDLFHTKAIIRSECQNMALDFFKNSQMNYVILTGNHDFENANCDGHALQCFKELKNIKIIDRPTVIEDGVFIPYTPDAYFIEVIPKDCAGKTLFCHQGIASFNMNDKHLSDSAIDPNYLNCFRQVFSGHYHIAQEKGNICYVGSPIQQNFGEAGDLKRIILWDSGTNNKKDLSCEDFPKFIIIGKTASQVLTETPSDLMMPVKDCDHIRFDISGPKDLLKKITKADVIERYGLKNEDVKINRRQTDNDKFDVAVEEALDYSKMFETWLRFQNTSLDKEKLIKLAVEFINASI